MVEHSLGGFRVADRARRPLARRGPGRPPDRRLLGRCPCARPPGMARPLSRAGFHKGTPRHAFLLGATVTVTHTFGVFALGLVTLLCLCGSIRTDRSCLMRLTLASGLLVIPVVGVQRVRFYNSAPKNLHAVDHGEATHTHHPHDHGQGAAPARPRPPARPPGHSWPRPWAMPPSPRGASSVWRYSADCFYVFLAPRRPAVGDRDPPDGFRLRPDRGLQLSPLLLSITCIGLLAVFARRAFSRVLVAGGRVIHALPRSSALVDPRRWCCTDHRGPSRRDLNRSESRENNDHHVRESTAHCRSLERRLGRGRDPRRGAPRPAPRDRSGSHRRRHDAGCLGGASAPAGRRHGSARSGASATL